MYSFKFNFLVSLYWNTRNKQSVPTKENSGSNSNNNQVIISNTQTMQNTQLLQNNQTNTGSSLNTLGYKLADRVYKRKPEDFITSINKNDNKGFNIRER